MDAKRILIISPFENEYTDRGGRNVDLAKNLEDGGHKVTLLTSDFNHGRKLKIDFPEDLGFYRVVKVWGYSGNLSFSRFFTHIQFSIKSFLLLRKEKYDVVFSSTIPPEISLLAKLITSNKTLYDVRDVWPDALLNYKKVPLLLKLVFNYYCSFFYKIAFDKKSKFIVVAPSFFKWIKRYKKGFINWKFIPLGFREETWSLNMKQSFSYDYFYAGGITPQFSLCDFKKKLSGNIIFLGQGSDFEVVKSCFPNAEMPGVVSRKEADLIMSNSRCLVLPSNQNARLPNKAFDYFSSNKDILLGDSVSREIKYLFTRVYPHRRNGSVEDFEVLSRKYCIKKLSGIILKGI